MRFELTVAIRYLKAKRKQAVISLITVISIAGVAAGVAALVIALAINAGFREDLQDKLLGAQSHIQILPRGVGGIANYRELTQRIEQMEGVVSAAPSIYTNVLFSTEGQQQGGMLKGVLTDDPDALAELAAHVDQGSLDGLQGNTIIPGRSLANALGAVVGDRVLVLGPGTRVTPFGGVPMSLAFETVGTFETGLYELDAHWAYVPLEAAQRLLRLGGDVAMVIEVKIEDIYQATRIGQEIVDTVGGNLEFTDWIAQNQPIFQALRLERLVMFITIGLIVFVAALNIVATLIMMVLEKSRDIAILMSMGAKPEQIRRVFRYQGLIIGVIGTSIGLVAGHVVSYMADKYRLISLAPDIYTIAYVPFRAQWLDSVIVAVAAISISYLATLYPSGAAAKLHPVEALRYE